MRFLAPAGITATIITSVASRFGGKFDGLRAAASHLSPLGFAAAPFCRFEVGGDLDKEVRRLAIRRAVHLRIGSA
jgi:hypothetical protein